MMPVAVRLSKNFYDRFGDEATNELVTLLNDVDLTYRSELKDAFAGNISVFDARLEQRAASVNARIDALSAEVNARIDSLAADVNARIDALEAAVGARFESFSAEVNARFESFSAQVDARIAQSEARMLRWMFGFWATNTLAILGLAFAVLRSH